MPQKINVTRKKRRMLELSGSALKWIGLVLTCMGTFSAAVLQRGVLRLDSYTNETLYAALEPGSERELMLCYEDDGTAARAGWVTWR